MIKINRLKKIKSNFPVLVGDKVVEKNTCNLLIDEISKSKAFDDMIMGGRSRINKGSKNFNNYIKSSNNSEKLFKLFNSKFFLIKYFWFVRVCPRSIFKIFRKKSFNFFIK